MFTTLLIGILFLHEGIQDKNSLEIPKTSLSLIKEFNLNDGTLQWAAFSPNGKSVAACGDRFIQMYNIESGERERKFKGHKKDIFRFAFSPDGKMVAGSSRDETVRIWNVKTAKKIKVLRAHTDRIIGVSFSADSKLLASTSADRSIRIWDCTNWKEKAVTHYSPKSNAMYVAFSPNGKYLAGSGYRGAVRLFAIEDNSLRALFVNHHDGGEMCSHVTFSPSGDHFLTSGWDKTVRLWDVKTGKEVWKGIAPKNSRCFEASVFSPDGSRIYSVTRDETFVERNAKTGNVISQFKSSNKAVRGFAIAKDGSMLATSGNNESIKVWKLTRN